ncbi:MAG: MarR family transcriptional regulator [Rubellimicrobium sp.]|nr:MarR family transcriptional regulator [Rubellimicrobium sp.]
MRERPSDNLAVTFISEILAVDQLVRGALDRVLPQGMELSQFSVLNHLAHVGNERTPAQLARTFHVTRGAMSNTLARLERAGWIHVRPDWDDARRKLVALSGAGLAARDDAVAAILPLIGDMVARIGADRLRAALPVMRDLRMRLLMQEDQGRNAAVT